MSFLHPWGLAIAGLAVIPILLHLFRHRTRRRVEFPALRYLDRTLREASSRDEALRLGVGLILTSPEYHLI